jgi:hypothetical protein
MRRLDKLGVTRAGQIDVAVSDRSHITREAAVVVLGVGDLDFSP